MNNKGFTLVELLASIIILSLILLIAVPSINGISRIVRLNSRNNLIKKIETSATNYAFDTKKTLVFVDELVQNGYLEFEDNTIIDPLNNTKLNCYLVKMKRVNNYYTAKFIDEKSYEINGICDESKINEQQEEININVLSNGVLKNELDKWFTSESIVLNAYSNNVEIDCNLNRCNWTSTNGYNNIGTDNIVIDLTDFNGILKGKYTFQMTKYIEESNDVQRYTSSIYLNIDNEKPIIYKDEIKITEPYIDTPTKEVTINASDGNGSGISGYAIIPNGSGCNNANYQDENKFEINKNGRYLVCVKDYVNNISSVSFDVNHIS